MKTNENYLIQSNLYTQSVLRNVKDIQKDILYYIQNKIDFRDKNPPEEIIFNYNEFLRYKKQTRDNAYSLPEILDFCTALISINGVFYNTKSNETTFFTLIDNVTVSNENASEFKIQLAKWGRIFFYEKYALEYAETTKIAYTQIENNIIDLKGEKKKKLFELLSQFKSTGVYKVSLEELKVLLGFIIYQSKKGVANERTEQQQLKFLFDDSKLTDDFERVEYLAVWSEFKRVFLDPAIKDFNDHSGLDISNITYRTIKTGRKITNLHFSFQKRYSLSDLDDVHLQAVKYFSGFGLSEGQILFLFQRIGYKNMYERFNKAVTFNNQYDNKDSQFFHQKIWFSQETGEQIKSLGGYLYDKVFPELKK